MLKAPGPLIINPLIYAELSIRFGSEHALDSALHPLSIRRDPLPYEAGFLAGIAFVEYRRRGGSRTSTLPGFFINAHAAMTGLRLLSRDASRYNAYFPELALISPRGG
ncbi:putative nucleic acid-binding protein [Microbacterium natoriense]|uniref:Nucleic acid-binding protein n=1 Tax=Microbacterium natoriense TaxID=284570 RepID=A0AAW8F188_9MICO|nr:DNA-binding protein [Microbacterium natoriense]MDQ0649530.1 putative nucleic acid-binding protein [Microbacterium natoriense]